MCEILGISGKNIESIKEAASFLEHREPDDSGLFINKFFWNFPRSSEVSYS
jgi:asparagine synthetase B (glutamine-hydrolysing)